MFRTRAGPDIHMVGDIWQAVGPTRAGKLTVALLGGYAADGAARRSRLVRRVCAWNIDLHGAGYPHAECAGRWADDRAMYGSTIEEEIVYATARCMDSPVMGYRRHTALRQCDRRPDAQLIGT